MSSLNEATAVAKVKDKYSQFDLDLTQESILDSTMDRGRIFRAWSELTVCDTDIIIPTHAQILEMLCELLTVVVGKERAWNGMIYGSVDPDRPTVTKYRLFAAPE